MRHELEHVVSGRRREFVTAVIAIRSAGLELPGSSTSTENCATVDNQLDVLERLIAIAHELYQAFTKAESRLMRARNESLNAD